MATLAILITILSLSLASAIMLLPEVISYLKTSKTLKEFMLFKHISKDSVSYVNQVSLSRELSSEEKKLLSKQFAALLFNTTQLDKRFLSCLDEQIESSLWNDDSDILDDDEDEDF